MITVIVPVFNGAHLVGESLPAMFGQTVRAQWIFVDDGSTDKTFEALNDLIVQHNANAIVFQHENNRGRAAARNTGLQHVETELVGFMDIDITPVPDFLEQFLAEFQEPEVVACLGKLKMDPDDPEEPYARYLCTAKRGPSENHAYKPTPWKYFLSGLSAIRHSVLAHVGGFNEALTYGEDLDLAVRLARYAPGGLHFVPGAVACMKDLGSLETAMAKMQEFGEHNLPEMVARAPELAEWTGVDVVDSAFPPSLKKLGAKILLRPSVAGLVQRLLPTVPRPLSNLGVRYLLGYTLARSYSRGLSRLS